MPCKIEIRKEIEKSVEQLTDSALGLSLDLSNKKADEVNKLFNHKVVEFVIAGGIIDRSIFIPKSLIQIYYDNELEIEKQEKAILLKEEEEKERKYVESKKEEWEQNREYLENDEPFTRVSVNEKPIPNTGIQGTLFDKYSLSSNLSSIHDEALDNIIKDLSERFDIPIKKIYSDASWKGRYTSKGEIELNTRTLKADTPFHEIAHPFIDLIEKQEIKLYDNLVKQIKAEKTILEEVQNNSYYKNLPENEQIKEAIVTAIGRYAAFNINPKTGKGLISAIKTLLQSISNYLKSLIKAEKIRLSGDWRNNDNINEQKLGKLKTISANITLSDLGAFFALGKGKYSLKNFNNKLYNESRKYEGKHLDIINDVLSELKKKNTYDKSWGWEQNLADKLAKKYPKVFDIENDPYSAANLKNYRESEQSFMDSIGQQAKDTFQNLYDSALNELNYVKQLITYGSNKELLNLMFLKHPNITISSDNSNENIYNIYVMENKPSYIEEDKEYVFVDKYNKWISISKRYKTKTGGTSYNPVTSEDLNWEKVIAKFQKLDTEEFRPKLEQFIKKNILEGLQHSYILSHTKESYIEESLRNMQGMYGEQLQFSEYDIIGMANKKILENILFANNIITNSILGSSGIWSSLNAYHPFVQELYQIKKKEFDKALLNDFTKRKEALKAILGFKKLQSELGLDVEEFESLSEEDENIAAPVPKWFLDMHSMASSGEYFDDIKMGLAKGITYLGASEEWDKKIENPEYKTRAEQILESKDLTIFLRDYFYPDYTGSTFNDLKQQFKTKYSLDSNQEEPTIKPRVEELFNENPELADQVYSKILTNSGLSAENVLSLLLKDNIIEKQCS
jgi:hypothetical protein